MLGVSTAMCAIAMEHGLAGTKKNDRKNYGGSRAKDRKVKPVIEAQKSRTIDYKA